MPPSDDFWCTQDFSLTFRSQDEYRGTSNLNLVQLVALLLRLLLHLIIIIFIVVIGVVEIITCASEIPVAVTISLARRGRAAAAPPPTAATGRSSSTGGRFGRGAEDPPSVLPGVVQEPGKV